MSSQKFRLKQDKFSDVREKHSKFFNVYCYHCGNHILLYQKDGKPGGVFKRLYLDRIIAPVSLAALSERDLKDIPDLVCHKCNRTIGVPSIYEEEQRKVYLLFSFSFLKKITSGIYPPKKPTIDVSNLP